jgi:hypothetical protein
MQGNWGMAKQSGTAHDLEQRNLRLKVARTVEILREQGPSTRSFTSTCSIIWNFFHSSKSWLRLSVCSVGAAICRTSSSAASSKAGIPSNSYDCPSDTAQSGMCDIALMESAKNQVCYWHYLVSS